MCAAFPSLPTLSQRKKRVNEGERMRITQQTELGDWTATSWLKGTFRAVLELDISSILFRRRQWHPTPVLLPGKSHGRRSLVGCSPWGREESDTIERLHFHFSRSCTGEGNGNPLQCSCLENPRDGAAGGLPSTGSHRVRQD